MSVLRAGAHECQIRSAPVLVLLRLQRFSITLKRRQRAKIKFILALCQQSETLRLWLQVIECLCHFFILMQKNSICCKELLHAHSFFIYNERKNTF
ncbi:hypothetical protein CTV99_17500 [Bacillus pumilus]|uniref:Uncharacterized protein n=1 Tax=Bacillus pumilus TaxID=1408 RepID=A0A2G8IPS9_BACPU|nr:hypothetical protein CTV99_17500 [Bacillus pumilus]